MEDIYNKYLKLTSGLRKTTKQSEAFLKTLKPTELMFVLKQVHSSFKKENLSGGNHDSTK